MKCDAEKRKKNFQIMQRLQLANKTKKHTKKQVGCPVDREQKKKKKLDASLIRRLYVCQLV